MWRTCSPEPQCLVRIGGAPVVVTARIRKSQVYFAKALGFEIVAAPSPRAAHQGEETQGIAGRHHGPAMKCPAPGSFRTIDLGLSRPRAAGFVGVGVTTSTEW